VGLYADDQRGGVAFSGDAIASSIRTCSAKSLRDLLIETSTGSR